jgi:hypothetical protein
MSVSISPHGQDVVRLLVAWELLGAEDIDPKQLLREMAIDDLFLVRENSLLAEDEDFLSIKMVGLEVMYRSGLLVGDWDVFQEGDLVTLSYTTVRQGHVLTTDAVRSGGLA